MAVLKSKIAATPDQEMKILHDTMQLKHLKWYNWMKYIINNIGYLESALSDY